MSTEEQPSTPSEPSNTRRLAVPLTGVIIAAVLVLFLNGNLDRTLYPIGLNYHACARNGLGATFCGKELDEYRARFNQAQREEAAIQAHSEEEEAKISRESEETQQRIREGRYP